VYVAASARLVAQTPTTRDTHRGILCGGGEVLQPVEREGAALLDPQVRQSVRKAARDHVVVFFAVERVCPLAWHRPCLVIRRARVGWDAECERRSGLPLNGTKVFYLAAEQPLDVAPALHRQSSHLVCCQLLHRRSRQLGFWLWLVSPNPHVQR
jgi:hypothetical protein